MRQEAMTDIALRLKSSAALGYEGSMRFAVMRVPTARS